MPKSSPKDPGSPTGKISDKRSSNRNKPETPKKSVGLGTVILFWPFLLFHGIIKPLPGFLRLPLRILGDPAIAGLYAGLVMGIFYFVRAQPFDMTKVAEMPERTVVFDRTGQELGRIHGEKRDVIRVEDVSQDFIFAILAREDKRFYKHGGVDWVGVGRAVVENVKRGGRAQGASTLTMQLARNSFPLKSKWLDFSDKIQELDRKLLETAVSYRIESTYTKEEILQHYVNRIFWGHQIRGIEEASRTYFEKHAKDLTLSESALLAGIVRGPNAFSPFVDAEKAIRERNTVLDRMSSDELKFVTKEQAEEAKKEPISIRPEWRRIFHDSYAMDSIRRELERILEEENIELGGLQITTTIDHRIQKKAEEALEAKLREIERKPGYAHQTRAAWNELPDGKPRPEYLQGSVVAIENLTGAVLAIVGGRDADESKFNRALQGRRQIGSVFKPFVYLAGFDTGIRPSTLISDGPISRGEIRGAGNWRPQNSDGKFGGDLPASTGLIRSRNTMSVRVGNRAGVDKVADVALSVGFEMPMPKLPTSYLGAWEATTYEVASAYTVFPNSGVRYAPRLIKEIRDRTGNVVWPEKGDSPYISYEAVNAGSAWSVSNILREVTTRGTAASIKGLGFNKPCGGKTGTTNDYKDAWFAGYTSSITCAVWVGLDTPKKTIDKGYGSTLALPVWVEVMKTADKLGYKAEGLKSQLSFVECRLCRSSGKRATAGCEAAQEAYTDNVPKDIVPAENDLCPDHPAKALAVGEEETESETPPKALPLDESSPIPEEMEPEVLRAIPVDEGEVQ
ncbi:transglycosylase domain-containing protein [Luteolibacter arcticus]|uniref:peptidoglycan glycosyltransferase n=1 Tax=Luteolibacter arcticus TaxID=1581411 RepID=A0ABT3GHF4_9BACT|nr:transglycosylase domain-containing protein [Luteolibacter arcticus]MCW1923052.1 transglycosylase domain-containing protein [Luteolibacter arcticus]